VRARTPFAVLQAVARAAAKQKQQLEPTPSGQKKAESSKADNQPAFVTESKKKKSKGKSKK
jgi:hypothetical protein